MAQNKISLLLTALVVSVFIVWFSPLGTVTYVRAEKPLPYGIPHGLNPKTERILLDLIPCESQGRATALNEVDRDGTPSYGLLQFKPSTLYWAVKTYHLLPDIEKGEILNVIYNGDLQIRAFLAMYGDGKPVSWWKTQFPQCSKNHGYWLDLSTETN